MIEVPNSLLNAVNLQETTAIAMEVDPPEDTAETTEIPITPTLAPTGGKIKLFLLLKTLHTQFL